MSGAFSNLPLFGFDVVVADPPWLYDLRSSNGEAKSPQAHYSCMPLDAIKDLRVGDLVGMNSWLFLWITAPLLPKGIDVMSAWGFTYKTTIIWRKTTASGKVRVGPGYVARTMHEQVLIGAIGAPAYTKALPSIFDGLAREHSRKPDEFYRLVEGFAPNARRLDLFTRESRPGWSAYGDQSTKFDTPALEAAE